MVSSGPRRRRMLFAFPLTVEILLNEAARLTATGGSCEGMMGGGKRAEEGGQWDQSENGCGRDRGQQGALRKAPVVEERQGLTRRRLEM